ncbi:MAG: riboflavin biosynthesis protein RibF [Candidatus Aminicenantes bacterium]|nr:riboflavin biosynthesis protein RibF [Candidatus Aminicenantes bacterium]
MKIYRRLEPFPGPHRPRAVAVGNFDGLHLGHRRILRRLTAYARRKGLVSLLLTFAPHPEKILGRGRVLMIQTLERRLELVRESGVDEVLVAPFDAAFSSLTPNEFIRRVLLHALNARTVFLGTNFRFGRRRAGTAQTLRAFGERTRLFEVRIVPPLKSVGRTVSSSRIRELLLSGDVSRAAALLGRPYEIRGRVVSGRAVGRRLGFPTANIRPENEILPPGVFLSRALFSGRIHPGLTYIGRRPTFGSQEGGVHVETHCLRRRQNLYGRRITIELLKRLRSDRKFPDAAALAARIRRDAARAESYFRRRESG